MLHKVLGSRKGISRGSTLIIIAIIVIVAIGVAYWWHYIYKPPSKVITRAGNISTSSPTNSASTPAPKKQPTSNAGRAVSGGTDTNGQTSATTNSGQWITSKSGNITVEQPIADATLQTGDTLVGTAKVSSVQFRLIDNSVGVLSEGTLSVVNGKFSGKLNFTPHASSGQLDVFSTDSNGVELNEIQIAVKF